MYVVGMKKEQSLEQLLEEAGFEFTVVDKCPDLLCDVCHSGDLPVAA